MAAFDSLLDELLLPCEADDPDLEGDELLAAVLTVLDEFEPEPEDAFVLLPDEVGCSTLLLTWILAGLELFTSESVFVLTLFFPLFMFWF